MSVEDQNSAGNAKCQDCSYGFKESQFYQQWDRPFMLNSDKESDYTWSYLRVNSKVMDPCLWQKKFEDSETFSVSWFLVTFH